MDGGMMRSGMWDRADTRVCAGRPRDAGAVGSTPDDGGISGGGVAAIVLVLGCAGVAGFVMYRRCAAAGRALPAARRPAKHASRALCWAAGTRRDCRWSRTRAGGARGGRRGRRRCTVRANTRRLAAPRPQVGVAAAMLNSFLATSRAPPWPPIQRRVSTFSLVCVGGALCCHIGYQ